MTFNLEAQSGPDDDLLPRMHEYALNLYRTYHRPVISIALLLFEECGVPEVPFTWQCGGKERSIFYPIMICMWEKNAHEIVQGQQRCLYSLYLSRMSASVGWGLTLRAIETHPSLSRTHCGRCSYHSAHFVRVRCEQILQASASVLLSGWSELPPLQSHADHREHCYAPPAHLSPSSGTSDYSVSQLEFFRIVLLPSTVGTSTSSPRAACVKLIGSSYRISFVAKVRASLWA